MNLVHQNRLAELQKRCFHDPYSQHRQPYLNELVQKYIKSKFYGYFLICYYICVPIC